MADKKIITDSSSLLEAIQSIINDEYREIVTSNFKLIETQNLDDSNKCSELEILGNVSNYSFTLDKRVSCSKCNTQLEPIRILKKSAKGVNKKNDLIVLCPSNKNGLLINAYIFELKSKNLHDGSKQILSGKILVEYILSLLKIRFNFINNIQINYYGILSSLATQQKHLPTNIKALQYNLKKFNRNEIEIYILYWHSNNKFYLRDFHEKIITKNKLIKYN